MDDDAAILAATISLSPAARTAYASNIRRFARFLGDRRIFTAQTLDVERFLQQIDSSTGRRRALSALRMFFGYFKTTGVLTRNPTLGLGNVKPSADGIEEITLARSLEKDGVPSDLLGLLSWTNVTSPPEDSDPPRDRFVEMNGSRVKLSSVSHRLLGEHFEKRMRGKPIAAILEHLSDRIFNSHRGQDTNCTG